MSVTEELNTESPTAISPRNAWIAYVAPMALFMLFSSIEGQFPRYYPYLYVFKAIVVTACLIAYRHVWSEIRFDIRMLLPALVVGGVVALEWVQLDHWIHYPHFAFLGQRVGYDPYTAITDPVIRLLFIAVRFYGLVIMVPVMEEIFWRSFLLRFITDPDNFQRLKQGEFSWTAFAVVVVAFGLAHPEWLEAIICAAAYGLLLRRTRSLFACIAAHAITNLALGLYVITAHAWKFW